jgi:BMFP domain-containing protein YqiC
MSSEYVTEQIEVLLRALYKNEEILTRVEARVAALEARLDALDGREPDSPDETDTLTTSEDAPVLSPDRDTF